MVKVASLSVWTWWTRNGNAARSAARKASPALFVSSGKKRTTRSRVQSSSAVYWKAGRPSTRYGTDLDIDLDAVARAGHHVALPVLRPAAVSGEQPGPLQDPVDA